MKKNLLKASVLFAVVFCTVLFAACGKSPAGPGIETEGKAGQTQSRETAPQSGAPSPGTDTEAPTPPKSPELHEVLAKVTGGADETGIYSIVVTLSDKAADKGTVEMVYYGAEGSPQENSVVNTFRVEYEKADGLFEIRTFFDGEVYQNLHKQTQVKVNNTFGAALRARCVIISYAPDGEETQEIYRADAERFFSPTK